MSEGKTKVPLKKKTRSLNAKLSDMPLIIEDDMTV